MSATKKTVFKGFDYMHCDDFAKYLSDMAAKGWHFKKWDAGLKFEKGEPEQAVYAVEVFLKASENDMRPEPKAQEFAEYCESAGWQFMDGKQKFCIFKKIEEDAVELFTPEERVTNAFKGTTAGTSLLLLVLYGINAFMQWSRLPSSFEATIFSGTFFFSISIWTILFLGQLFAFGNALWMKNKLMKKIREGEKIYIGSKKDGKHRLVWNDIYIGILLLVLMAYFFAIDQVEIVVMNVIIVVGTFVFAFLLNKFRPEHDTSIIMQIVFTLLIAFTFTLFIVIGISKDVDGELTAENVPLKISDYRETEDSIRDASHYHEENVFGTSDKYFIYGKEESIHYYVYVSKYPEILDKVWEDIVEGKKYNENVTDCTSDWMAQKAIRNSLGRYYVRYDNMILDFEDYEDVYLTKEQIEIILENLDLR